MNWKLGEWDKAQAPWNPRRHFTSDSFKIDFLWNNQHLIIVVEIVVQSGVTMHKDWLDGLLF